MSLKNQILLCMDEPENYKDFAWDSFMKFCASLVSEEGFKFCKIHENRNGATDVYRAASSNAHRFHFFAINQVESFGRHCCHCLCF